ncbi:Proteinase-activated receptor 1 [Triplophysa tibetana]|uniref:Proteinase-activated receptor 1 n=1 Tax=Triplophysa tibetana TaxID=1572043 RepID=A0A5A9PDP8_9TELE|nr:Proteinase-activated receptor 1 [Triplophysa tibetana]
MGLKSILLLTLAAHICTSAIFNDSLEDEPSRSQRNMTRNPQKAPSGRSFAVKEIYETQTYEPIDYIDPPDEKLNDSFIDKNTRQGRRYSGKAVTFDGRLLCNGSNLTAMNCNRTKAYSISDDAVLFLKGPLVTRVMPSFYILIFIIGLPLNALALLTFTCKIKEKKPAVIFMSNLACVDLLFTLLLPLKIHYHLNGSHWVFGEAACRVLTSAFYCYMYCSILLMMCIGMDRLVAVVFPVTSLTWRKKSYSVYACALVWVLALVGTVPLLSVTQTFNIKHLGVTCHDALLYENTADQTYVFQFSILTCVYYFLPLVVTLACYSTIIRVLSAKSGRLATSSSSTINKRRRAVIMIIAVLTEFLVCFAPTNGILLYHCVLLATGGVGGEGNTSYMTYMLALCAGSSSVFLDPLLYYYGSSQCRQKINSWFWWKKSESSFSNSYSMTKSSHASCEYSQAHIKV